MSSPLVSICIPTYKGARFLKAAIDSVLSQSFADLELLVIDDNSPDDTEAIVRSITDPRIRYIRNDSNLGPEGNWNRCLNESRGVYFKLLPHDDLLLPGCLEKQVGVLSADRGERIALVFCARRILSGDRVVTTRGYPFAKAGPIPGRRVVGRCVSLGTNLLGEPGAVLFRRSLALRVGRFDATNPYVIDLDYWCRLLLHGAAYYLDEPLAAFRVSSGSWSVAIGRKQASDFHAFVRRISAEPAHGIGPTRRAAGRAMASVNGMLRQLFYKVVPH